MRHVSIRDQMTQKLTIIGHRTALFQSNSTVDSAGFPNTPGGTSISLTIYYLIAMCCIRSQAYLL